MEWEEKHVATEEGKLVKRQFFFFLSRREAAYINIENAPIKRNKLMIQESVVNC